MDTQCGKSDANKEVLDPCSSFYPQFQGIKNTQMYANSIRFNLW